jgi:3' terminal RNA ribose 2'-O-methyltransferase Hen1
MRSAMRHGDRMGRRQSQPTSWVDLAWDDAAPREPTALHALRLQTVHETLRACGARSVADFGCGDGALVRRLLGDTAITRIVAIDSKLSALGRLERSALAAAALVSGRLRLLHGSFTTAHTGLRAVDAVVMVETIEHVEPARLSGVEQHVFGVLKANAVIVTTPNQEYNVLFGMAPGQMRESSHHFEWSRQRFRAWAAGVALRHGYALRITGIGAADPHHGSPTQMALFTHWASNRRGEARPKEDGDMPG